VSRFFGGRPRRLPFARAFRSPAFTRSTMSDRSNSATAPRTVNTVLPVGVLVSTCSLRLKSADAVKHIFSLSIRSVSLPVSPETQKTTPATH